MPNSIVDILRGRARDEANRIAYTYLGDGETESFSVTYAELDDAASTTATWLLGRANRGDRVLLLYPSGLDFLKAFYGCLYAGIIAVPLFPPRRNRIDQRITDVASDAQATLALTTSQILADIEQRLENATALQQLPWAASNADEVKEQTRCAATEIDSADLAFLQYTSGSTSAPKGVMVSHGNLLTNLQELDDGFRHTRDSIGVSWLPVFHDMGLVYGMLQPVFNGFRCYFMPPHVFFQRPLRWLQAISRYRATHTAAPNFAYDMCVRSVSDEECAQLDLSSLQVALNGAEPVREMTQRCFIETFKSAGFQDNVFCPGYGLAEATLAVSNSHNGSATKKCEVSVDDLSTGKVVETSDDQSNRQILVGSGPVTARTRVAIVDPDSLVRCPENVIGEIWVSGPTVAQGYWKRDDLTTETFRAHLADTGEGPFLRTGDLGFLNDGELYITGRLKDLIIVRGQNIFPQDIELTVEQCHPALRPNCGAAFGVDFANEERLVVAQEVNRSSRRSLDANEIVDAIRNAVYQKHAVAPYAVVLLQTASIAKTSSGKIQRHACRNGFLNNTLNVIGQWQEPEPSANNFPVVSAPEQMDVVDATFLDVDSESTPQVIAAICVLDKQPNVMQLKTKLAQSLHVFPRLKQKVVVKPRLAWCEDAGFSLDNHIRCVQIPTNSTRNELYTEASRFIRTAPGKDHPLWEIVIVSNGNDQTCLILRMHHTLSDGVRLIRFLGSLCSNSRDGNQDAPVVPEAIFAPQHRSFIAKLGHTVRCSRKLIGEAMGGGGKSAMIGKTAGERYVTTVILPRSDIVRIMQSQRGSIHDTLFTLVANAVQRYNQRAGVPNKSLRLVIPMSVPPTCEKGGLGNHLVISALTLPLSEPDLVRQFETTRERFARMKEDGTIGAYRFAADAVHRLVPRFMHRRVWESMLRKTDMICTILLGPEDTRYVAGARVESIYGVPASVINHGASFAFVSYAGTICTSIVTDANVLPDPRLLANDFEQAFADLLRLSNEGLASQAPQLATGNMSFSGDGPLGSLTTLVCEELAHVLGASDANRLPRDHRLTDMGVDSMLSTELLLRLETRLERRLPSTLLVDHPTIESIVEFLSPTQPDREPPITRINVKD